MVRHGNRDGPRAAEKPQGRPAARATRGDAAGHPPAEGGGPARAGPGERAGQALAGLEGSRRGSAGPAGAPARRGGRVAGRPGRPVKSYFDSSVLVKIYVTEVHSARARREVQGTRQVPLTWLHTLEIGNALRLLAGRNLLSTEEAASLLEHFEDDRQAGRLVEAAVDWPKVFHEAVQLSRRHAARHLCRSLDILHVAAAAELGCARFVSADARQLALARAAGLKPVDIRAER
ncbi:MAG: hypothetical protein C0502_01365 [Opitutus sp.]|nr:hypothetical protein [Opitutus sp.]